MDRSKIRTMFLSIIAIVVLIVLLVGATYAYFGAQAGAGSQADVKVTTYTTDLLTFSTGDNIDLNISQSNFASGTGNQIGNTYAKAMLTANNKTNSATAHYYVYLNVSNNTFEYSINESTPELILTVTDNAGTEVTDISGLKHVSVKDAKGVTISGYDVTTRKGLLTLFNNKEITATPTKEEQWNIKLTFVNYDADQTKNAGKTFNAKAMVQKELIPQVVSDVCNGGENLSNCITTLYTKSTSAATNIYYHDSTLANGAGDNSYRYAGASESVNNFVCFGSGESPCPTDNLYRIIGVFGDKVKLIKYDYANSNLLGTDGDYSTNTYSKSSVSTYKGSLTTVNRYYWNYKNDTSINSGNGSNTWSTSLLNKTNLNKNFIANIEVDWAAKIAETTWKVGGNTWSNIGEQPAKTAYQNEVVKPEPGSKSNGETEYSAKIGLMYASDYGFAAAPSAWTTNLWNYNGEAITSANWMYMGLQEWTISRHADDTSIVLYVGFMGNLSNGYARFAYATRPVFNLVSSTTYVSGDGTQNSPIHIN